MNRLFKITYLGGALRRPTERIDLVRAKSSDAARAMYPHVHILDLIEVSRWDAGRARRVSRYGIVRFSWDEGHYAVVSPSCVECFDRAGVAGACNDDEARALFVAAGQASPVAITAGGLGQWVRL